MANARVLTLWTLAEAAVTLMSSLGMVLLVASVIGPHAFGIASIAFFVGSLAETVISIPFAEPLIRRQVLTDKIVNTAFSCMLIVAVSAYVALLLIAPLLASLYGDPLLIMLITAQGLTCLALGIRGTPEALLARSFQFRLLALRGIIAKIFGASVSVALAFMGAGAWSIIIGNVMYAFSATFLVLIVSVPKLRFALVFKDALELLRFGRFSLADALLNTIPSRFYGFITAYFFDVRTFGEISIAFRLNDSIVSMLGQVINRIALPVLSSVAGDPKCLLARWVTGTRLIMIVALPAMLGLAAVGPDLIILVLGAQWIGAAPALTAICIYSAFNLSAVLVAPTLKAMDRPDLLMSIHAALIGFLVFATFIAVPFGLLPTLIAYAASGAVYWLASMFILRSTMQANPLQQLGISGAFIPIAAIIMALVIFGERSFLINYLPLVRLLILVSTGIAIYAFLIAVFERHTIRALWQTQKKDKK